MPEITLKKNAIYLNKYIRTETDRTTFFIYQKTSISVQGQGASRYGRGKAARSPRNAISIMILACVAAFGSSGRKKERVRARETRGDTRSFLRPLLPRAFYAG